MEPTPVSETLLKWKEKFYPTQAREFRNKRKSSTNALAAVKHSLLKWQGLKKEVLKDYDAKKIPLSASVLFQERGYFEVEASSCALCRLYQEANGSVVCRGCPIYIVTGKSCEIPYSLFFLTDNPEHMIDLLTRVEKALEEM